jgi:hypothetical protein
MLAAIARANDETRVTLQKEYLVRIRQLELRRRLDAATAAQDSIDLLAAHERAYVDDLAEVARLQGKSQAEALQTLQTTAQTGIRLGEATGKISSSTASSLRFGVDYAGRLGAALVNAASTGRISPGELPSLLSLDDLVFSGVCHFLGEKRNFGTLLALPRVHSELEATLDKVAERYASAFSNTRDSAHLIAAFDAVYAQQAVPAAIEAPPEVLDEGGGTAWLDQVLITDLALQCRVLLNDNGRILERGSVTSISWRGGCKNSLAEGDGTLEMIGKAGPVASFTGIMAGGEFAGKGEFSDRVGKWNYKGDFRRSLPDGFGEFLFGNGARYVGEIRRGQFSGKGTFAYYDGNSYTGQWWGGMPHGAGTSVVKGESVTGTFRYCTYDYPEGNGSWYYRTASCPFVVIQGSRH